MDYKKIIIWLSKILLGNKVGVLFITKTPKEGDTIRIDGMIAEFKKDKRTITKKSFESLSEAMKATPFKCIICGSDEGGLSPNILHKNDFYFFLIHDECKSRENLDYIIKNRERYAKNIH